MNINNTHLTLTAPSQAEILINSSFGETVENQYPFVDIRSISNHWFKMANHQLQRQTDDCLSVFRNNESDLHLLDVEILEDFNRKTFTKQATRNYTQSLKDYFGEHSEITSADNLIYMKALREPSEEITKAVLNHLKLCKTNAGLEDFSRTLSQFLEINSFTTIIPYYNIIILSAPFCLFPQDVSPQELMAAPMETICATLLQINNEILCSELGNIISFQNSIENSIPELSGFKSIYNSSLSMATRLGIQWGFRHRYMGLGFLHLLNPSINLALTWAQTPQISYTERPNVGIEQDQMIEECARIIVNLITFD